LLVVVGVIFEGEEILSELRAHGWRKSEHKVAKIGFALLVIGLAGELLFQTRIESADAMLKREADKKIADAQRETAQIRERAALTEERLLSERRLTANEPWRLERLERVVLPRTLPPEVQARIADGLKASGFHAVNLVVLPEAETMWFGIAMMQSLQNAGLLAAFSSLPSNSKAPSFIIVAVDDEGDKLSDFFFQQFGIGEGWRAKVPLGSDASKSDPSLASVPTDRNSIVIGSNAGAAFSGARGQPGEGLDVHGEPVPAPQ